MASEQTNANEAIRQAVVEATRAAIQVIAAARTERTQNVGPRLGGPVMKQPSFNWEAKDKYNKLKKYQARGKQYFPIIQNTTNRIVSNHKKTG